MFMGGGLKKKMLQAAKLLVFRVHRKIAVKSFAKSSISAFNKYSETVALNNVSSPAILATPYLEDYNI
jgi:hypothetical protein